MKLQRWQHVAVGGQSEKTVIPPRPVRHGTADDPAYPDRPVVVEVSGTKYFGSATEGISEAQMLLDEASTAPVCGACFQVKSPMGHCWCD